MLKRAWKGCKRKFAQLHCGILPMTYPQLVNLIESINMSKLKTKQTELWKQ